MVRRFMVFVALGAGLGLICAGVGCFDPVPTPASDQPEAPANVVSAAPPVSAADAAEPTPVNDPAADQAAPVSGIEDPVGTSAGTTRPGSADPVIVQPNIGWGNTINLLDLLTLLPADTLGDVLNPATDNPGSFSTLELLCRDEGFSDSFCRSRYGNP